MQRTHDEDVLDAVALDHVPHLIPLVRDIIPVVAMIDRQPRRLLLDRAAGQARGLELQGPGGVLGGGVVADGAGVASLVDRVAVGHALPLRWMAQHPADVILPSLP